MIFYLELEIMVVLRMNNFLQRFLTGCILVLLFSLCTYLGNIYLNFFFLISLIFSLYELNKAFKNYNINCSKYSLIGYIYLLVLFISNFLNENYFLNNHYSVILIIFIYMFILFIFDNDTNKISSVSMAIFSCIYICLLGDFLIINYTDYLPKLFTIIAIAVGTDVFAYLGGSLLGKHKLIPKISPKKTIEGAIIGLIGGFTLGYLVLYYFGIKIDNITYILLILSALCCELGDLFASAIKRQCNIKDFGHFLPGHGGALDRLDGILFIILIMRIFKYV